MRVVIAGGHGKIALRLERLLAARGDVPLGLVRDADQAADLLEAGAQTIVLSLEEASVADLAEQLQGADAVVFAAGAGPGSSPERTLTVDRDGAVLLADAALGAGVRRYVLVSSIGAGAPAPAGTEPSFVDYLAAKTAAEEHVRGTDLAWTVLRPGTLTDDPGTGLVELGPSVTHGEVTRDDVAEVLLALLDAPDTAGQVLELVGGSTPISVALAP